MKNPEVDKRELPPYLASVGMHQTKKGWVVYSLVTQGDSVVKQAIHGEPLPLDFAAGVLRKVVLAELVNRRLPLVAQLEAEDVMP